MLIMPLIWLGANALIGAWLCYCTLRNPILYAIEGWRRDSADGLLRILPVISLSAHAIIAVGVSLFVSVGTAVAVTSLIVFGFSLTVYFMSQRFASVADSGFGKGDPTLPGIAFVAFLASTGATIRFLGWVWGVVPILLWFALGFVCAEWAIQRYISMCRRHGIELEPDDRSFAIFSVNRCQGRHSLFGSHRYPFP
jgi:hypothetical protein